MNKSCSKLPKEHHWWRDICVWSLIDIYGYLWWKQKSDERAIHSCSLGISCGKWRCLPAQKISSICRRAVPSPTTQIILLDFCEEKYSRMLFEQNKMWIWITFTLKKSLTLILKSLDYTNLHLHLKYTSINEIFFFINCHSFIWREFVKTLFLIGD